MPRGRHTALDALADLWVVAPVVYLAELPQNCYLAPSRRSLVVSLYRCGITRGEAVADALGTHFLKMSIPLRDGEGYPRGREATTAAIEVIACLKKKGLIPTQDRPRRTNGKWNADVVWRSGVADDMLKKHLQGIVDRHITGYWYAKWVHNPETVVIDSRAVKTSRVPPRQSKVRKTLIQNTGGS